RSPIAASLCRPEFYLQVPAFRISKVSQAVTQQSPEWLTILEVENANCDQLWLLRPHRARQTDRRAADQRDELAPPHSITSSARASSVGGMVMPSVLVVLRLITSSNLVGCSTGRSAGL